MKTVRVLIAGVAGASLGTEILKSLRLNSSYEIYGCDISNLAYGLYEDGFANTFCIDRNQYIENILDICKQYHIDVIVPGAEEPTSILSSNRKYFQNQDIVLLVNDADVIETCSNKLACFELLSKKGIRTPLFANANNFESIFHEDIPCIIKPSTGSGGSSYVFLAKNKNEALIYCDYLIRNDKQPIIQEYIPHFDGEFTVGTLVLGEKIGSIALKRVFNNKLSVLQKSEYGLISTGYSQGLIEEFHGIRTTCEIIAKELGSIGPLNVQGRVYKDEFVPFEINPRFSASTFLRALSGFNEIDLYIKYNLGFRVVIPKDIRYGYYMRSLTENCINRMELK
jgi:carbamoyl-phosphate synthase large subunit